MILFCLLPLCDIFEINEIFLGPDKSSILSNSKSPSVSSFAPSTVNELSIAHLFQLFGPYQLLLLLLLFELLFEFLDLLFLLLLFELLFELSLSES